MINFCIHAHPVLAVTCPHCGRAEGAWCIRPSGHKASVFHKSREALADSVFIAQHGTYAKIERIKGRWFITTTYRRSYYQGDAQLPLL